MPSKRAKARPRPAARPARAPPAAKRPPAKPAAKPKPKPAPPKATTRPPPKSKPASAPSGAASEAELEVPLPGGRRHVLSLAFVRDGDEFMARMETDSGHITELKNRSLDQLLTLVAGELEDLLE